MLKVVKHHCESLEYPLYTHMCVDTSVYSRVQYKRYKNIIVNVPTPPCKQSHCV